MRRTDRDIVLIPLHCKDAAALRLEEWPVRRTAPLGHRTPAVIVHISVADRVYNAAGVLCWLRTPAHWSREIRERTTIDPVNVAFGSSMQPGRRSTLYQ